MMAKRHKYCVEPPESDRDGGIGRDVAFVVLLACVLGVAALVAVALARLVAVVMVTVQVALS